MAIINLFNRKQSAQDDFTIWITPFVKSLHATAFHYTRNASNAEDLVQEVMTEVYVRGTWKSAENPKAWLTRCLYHRFIDQYRKHKKLSLVDNLDDVAEPMGDGCPSENITNKQLNSAIEALPANQRALVCLCDIEGYTLVDLSNILQKPLGTLKSDLHRGRQRIKKALTAQPFEQPVRHIVEGK